MHLKGAMRNVINLPSDFILQIAVLSTYDSGQNSISRFKPPDDEDHMNILEKIWLGKTRENIISMNLDEVRFLIGLKVSVCRKEEESAS